MIYPALSRCLLMVVGFSLLSACAITPIESGTRARMKSVGVISLMGDEVVFERIGTTIFGNDRKTVPTETFGLHQMGQDLVVASLQGRRATALAGERARVAQVVKLGEMQRLLIGGSVNKEAMSLEARRLGAAHHIDALIVLVPGQFQLYGSNGYIQGYTLYQRSLFGHEGSTAFAVQGIEVYDTHTGKLLGHASSVGFKDVSNAAWHDGVTQEARDCFANLIKNNAETMLTGLGLRSEASAIH